MVAGKEARNSLRDSLTRGPSSIKTCFRSVWRLMVRICFTRSEARLLDFSTWSRYGRMGLSSANSRWAISLNMMMGVRMLLKSWAMPPASVPMASIFWACRSWDSSLAFSSSASLYFVISRLLMRRPRWRPSVLYTG